MESISKKEFIYDENQDSKQRPLVRPEQLYYENYGVAQSVKPEAKPEPVNILDEAGSSLIANECPGCHSAFSSCEELQKHIILNLDALQTGSLRCNLSYRHVFQSDPDAQLSASKPYKCQECDRSFKTRGEVRSHELIHTQDRPFSCGGCLAQFKRKTELRRHELVHLNLFPYKCMECVKCFRTRGELKSHFLIHSNYRHFQCSECNLEFKRRAELNRHRTCHQTPSSSMCMECRRITNPNELKLHLMSSHGVRLFKCQYCSAEFIRESDLKTHSITHVTATVECSTCKNKIDNVSNSIGSPILCPSCVKVPGDLPKLSIKVNYSEFSGRNEFSEHSGHKMMTVNEDGEGTFACGECDKVFLSKAQLSSHRITHSPVKAYRKNELCVIRESTPDV